MDTRYAQGVKGWYKGYKIGMRYIQGIQGRQNEYETVTRGTRHF